MLSRSGSPTRMSREDVEYFRAEFDDRMVRDIDREIAWQRTNPNALAGNVLCALGLVVYTEVLGSSKADNRAIETRSKRF